MARIKIVLASAAVAFAAASPAFADPLAFNFTSPYIEVGGGLSTLTPTLSDLTNNNTSTNPLYSSSIDSQTQSHGVTFRGALGAVILPNTRGEIGLNISRGSGKFNVSAEGSGTIGVDATTFALLANIWHDFDIAQNVSIHVGGGLGAGVVTASVDPGTGGPFTHAGVAYMAGAGATFGLGNSGASLTLDYRINGVTGANSLGTASVQTPWEMIAGTVGTNFDQAITVGIRLPLH